MKYEKIKIALKYNNPEFRSFHNGDEIYVALDDRSGGYPYQVNAFNAHGFKSEKHAIDYIGSDDFSVVTLKITVEEI